MSELRKTTLLTEDCVLHVTFTGSGPDLLILIPGGHGTGSAFYAALPGLAESGNYTAATYDRRGHFASRFTPSGAEINEAMNPAQSARDVLAVMRHLGFERASVFGTSLGGAIALQFGVQFPGHVDRLIAHEAPTMALLQGEEGTKWMDWCFSVYRLYKTVGARRAMLEFLGMTVGWKATATASEGMGIPPPQSEEEVEMDRDHEWWFENEFMLTIYTPNLFELRAHLRGEGVGTMRVACTVGEASGHAPYARTTYVQRDILGCQHHVWPGGHLLHAVDVDGFVRAMLESLAKLDKE
jgi:pimeloyl-ACP methyl ester carboxylesterase